VTPRVPPRPRPADEVAKRALDVGLVLVTSPVTVVLGLAIALAIRLDSPGSPLATLRSVCLADAGPGLARLLRWLCSAASWTSGQHPQWWVTHG
jgi:hypothetical protein